MSKVFAQPCKRATKCALTAVLMIGLLAASVPSALANTGGTGAFNATAHVNVPPDPNAPCATYSLQTTELAFVDGSAVTMSSETNPLSTNFQWGENGDGTYHPQTNATGSTSCKSGQGPGAGENGFTGTLRDQTRNAVCTLTAGAYQRGANNNSLALSWTFAGVTKVPNSGPGLCPTAPLTVKANLLAMSPPPPLPSPVVIGPIEIYDVAACDSIIAPTTCALVDGQY